MPSTAAVVWFGDVVVEVTDGLSVAVVDVMEAAEGSSVVGAAEDLLVAVEVTEGVSVAVDVVELTESFSVAAVVVMDDFSDGGVVAGITSYACPAAWQRDIVSVVDKTTFCRNSSIATSLARMKARRLRGGIDFTVSSGEII